MIGHEPEISYLANGVAIHQPSFIHGSVKIGADATIWHGTTILEGAEIGEGAVIGDHCYIGRYAKIGPHVRVQHGSQLCERIEIGEYAFIGVGVRTAPDRHPKTGNIHYRIEPPKIGAHASIGTGAILLPGVVIGDGAMVGMGSLVTKNVPPYTTVAGHPARPIIRRRKPQYHADLGRDVLYRGPNGDHIAVISLNRPPMNTYTNSTLRALESAWALAEDDASVRCIILTGNGDHFCAGHDLKAAQYEHLASEPPAIHYGDLAITKPVIAAVKGYALGGGASMALACDLLIMANGAKLGYPQAKHGIISIGGPQRLPRILPGLARWLLFSGEMIDAWRLMGLGICVDMAGEEALMDVAMRYAERIAQASPDSVRVLKQSIELGSRYPLADAFLESKKIAAEYEATEVYQDNLKAFLERRTPGWKA